MGSGAPLMDIASDKVVRFQTAVRSVPQYDPDKPQMISQGPSICLFNHSDPQDVLAGWLFAQFLLTDFRAGRMGRVTLELPEGADLAEPEVQG